MGISQWLALEEPDVARGAEYEDNTRCIGCDLPNQGAPHSCTS